MLPARKVKRAEMSDLIGLADIEEQIAQHQQAIKDLCEVGIRMDETAAMPGHQIRKWLTSRGVSDKEATALIVQVINERRQARGGAPAGQCTSVTAPYPTREAGRG